MVFSYAIFYICRREVKPTRKMHKNLPVSSVQHFFVITVNLCPYPNSQYYNHIHHSLLPCLTTVNLCPYPNSHYYNHIHHSLLPCLTTAQELLQHSFLHALHQSVHSCALPCYEQPQKCVYQSQQACNVGNFPWVPKVIV